MTVSLITSIGVAVDRYWAIAHPFSYHSKFSRKITIMLIVFYWTLGFAIGSLDIGKQYESAYRWSCFTVFLLSLSAFVTLNFTIYRQIKKRLSRPANLDRTRVRREKREGKLAKTISIICLIYLLLLCPYFILKFLHKTCNVKMLIGFDLKKLRKLSRNLIILNSALNSTIYAYRVKVIRDEVKRIFKLPRNQPNLSINRPTDT